MRVCMLFIVISGFVVSAHAGRPLCNKSRRPGHELDQCNGHGTCERNQEGQPRLHCICSPGWMGEECETNVDECAASTSPCDTNADCTDTDGSYTCACKAGYTGSGTVGDCTDVDECAASTSPCDTNADCTDTDGSYTCACKAGYTGSGTVGDCTVTLYFSAWTESSCAASCGDSTKTRTRVCESAQSGVDSCSSQGDLESVNVPCNLGACPSGPTVATICGGTVNSDTAVLESPNFPLNYPENAYCTWLIIVEADKIVQLTFINFEVESFDNDFYYYVDDGDCPYDHLIVYDGATESSTQLGTYCGTTLPDTLQSTGSNMLLVFSADEIVQMKGFEIGYSSVPAP